MFESWVVGGASKIFHFSMIEKTVGHQNGCAGIVRCCRTPYGSGRVAKRKNEVWTTTLGVSLRWMVLTWIIQWEDENFLGRNFS